MKRFLHCIMYAGLAASPSFLKAQPVMAMCLLMNLPADILIQSTQQVQPNDVKPGCTVFSDRSTDAMRCNEYLSRKKKPVLSHGFP